VPHRFHAEDRGCTALEQLGDSQARRPVDRFGVVCRLQGPDAALQPVEQLQIVGQPAEKSLAQMNVRLHEPRQHPESGCVNRALGWPRDPAQLNDTTAFDSQIRGGDVVVLVGGNQQAIANQQRHWSELRSWERAPLARIGSCSAEICSRWKVDGLRDPAGATPALPGHL